MNMEPLSRKRKWNSFSSKPAPIAANSLAPESPSLFIEPQDKNPLNAPSLALSYSIPNQWYPHAC